MASVRKREWTHKGEARTAWVVNYTDQGGKRRLKTFALKKEADRYRARIEVEIEQGLHTASSQTATVAKVAEAYIRSCEQKVREGELGAFGQITRTRIVDRYVLPALGARQVAELTFSEVEAWHTGLLKTLAPSTAKGHLLTLKKIEDFARKRGMTKRSVVGEVAAETTGRAGRIRTFTKDQIQTILSAVDERTPHQRHRAHLFLKCAVHLATFCGLRFGEIVGLTASNIDLEGRVLRIRHSLTQLDELKGPKTTAGNRDVPMPKLIALLLSEWCRAYYNENERNLVFRDVRGGPYARSGFHKNLWHRLLIKADLFEKGNLFHFHALRHFAASMMIETGIPLPDVASLLGHQKFDMTLQVYAHPIVGGHRRHEAIDRMAGAFSLGRDNSATLAFKPLELHAL